MTRPVDRLDAFVDALLRNKRPPRFPVDPEDEGALRAAAALRSLTPGADSPDPHFIERLKRSLEDAPVYPSWRSRLSRRRFLEGVGIAAAAGVAGAAADRLLRRTGDSGTELVPDNGAWRRVAAVADVPVGRPLRFTSGPVEGFVVNQGDHLEVLSAICTHMGCVLHADPPTGRFRCPCHDASFSFEGAPLSREYVTRPLPRLQSRIVDGHVEVFTA